MLPFHGRIFKPPLKAIWRLRERFSFSATPDPGVAEKIVLGGSKLTRRGVYRLTSRKLISKSGKSGDQDGFLISRPCKNYISESRRSYAAGVNSSGSSGMVSVWILAESIFCTASYISSPRRMSVSEAQPARSIL